MSEIHQEKLGMMLRLRGAFLLHDHHPNVIDSAVTVHRQINQQTLKMNVARRQQFLRRRANRQV
jgi:hypothetical protein